LKFSNLAQNQLGRKIPPPPSHSTSWFIFLCLLPFEPAMYSYFEIYSLFRPLQLFYLKPYALKFISFLKGGWAVFFYLHSCTVRIRMTQTIFLDFSFKSISRIFCTIFCQISFTVILNPANFRRTLSFITTFIP